MYTHTRFSVIVPASALIGNINVSVSTTTFAEIDLPAVAEFKFVDAAAPSVTSVLPNAGFLSGDQAVSITLDRFPRNRVMSSVAEVYITFGDGEVAFDYHILSSVQDGDFFASIFAVTNLLFFSSIMHRRPGLCKSPFELSAAENTGSSGDGESISLGWLCGKIEMLSKKKGDVRRVAVFEWIAAALCPDDDRLSFSVAMQWVCWRTVGMTTKTILVLPVPTGAAHRGPIVSVHSPPTLGDVLYTM